MLTTDHKKLQLVVSIALIDNHDQILISKRPEKKHLSGYWEFPGGKVEKNETPENAIIREIKEELNVDINNKCIAPLSFQSLIIKNFNYYYFYTFVGDGKGNQHLWKKMKLSGLKQTC